MIKIHDYFPVKQLDGSIMNFALRKMYRDKKTKDIIGILVKIEMHDTECSGFFTDEKDVHKWKDISWNFHHNHEEVL